MAEFNMEKIVQNRHVLCSTDFKKFMDIDGGVIELAADEDSKYSLFVIHLSFNDTKESITAKENIIKNVEQLRSDLSDYIKKPIGILSNVEDYNGYNLFVCCCTLNSAINIVNGDINLITERINHITGIMVQYLIKQVAISKHKTLSKSLYERQHILLSRSETDYNKMSYRHGIEKSLQVCSKKHLMNVYKTLYLDSELGFTRGRQNVDNIVLMS